MRKFFLITATVSTLFVAACGGGDDNASSSSSTAVPATEPSGPVVSPAEQYCATKGGTLELVEENGQQVA